MSCGLTMSTIVDAHRTASSLERVAATPRLAASSLTRSSRRPVTMISSGMRPPDRINPEIRASPILPPPRNATFRSLSAAGPLPPPTSITLLVARRWMRRTRCSQAARPIVSSDRDTTACRTARTHGRARRPPPAPPGDRAGCRTTSGTRTCPLEPPEPARSDDPLGRAGGRVWRSGRWILPPATSPTAARSFGGCPGGSEARSRPVRGTHPWPSERSPEARRSQGRRPRTSGYLSRSRRYRSIVPWTWSLDSISIMTSIVRSSPVAACRTRSMFSAQSSLEVSRPSWVSLTEMLQSSPGASRVRSRAWMYPSAASAACAGADAFSPRWSSIAPTPWALSRAAAWMPPSKVSPATNRSANRRPNRDSVMSDRTTRRSVNHNTGPRSSVIDAKLKARGTAARRRPKPTTTIGPSGLVLRVTYAAVSVSL